MALLQFITLFQPMESWTECHWETRYMSFIASSWMVLIKYIFQHGWFGVKGCRSCQKYPRLHAWPAWAQVSHLCHSPMLWMSTQPASLPYMFYDFDLCPWDICWWTKVSMKVHDCFQLIRSAVHTEEERAQFFCVVLWSCLSGSFISVSLNIPWIGDHYCTASMLGLWQSS